MSLLTNVNSVFYIIKVTCRFYYLSYGEMVDFGKSDKMIKLNGKVDKSNTYNRFNSNILLFIQGTSSDKNFLSFSTF